MGSALSFLSFSHCQNTYAVRVQSSITALSMARIRFILSSPLVFFGSHSAGNPAAGAGAP